MSDYFFNTYSIPYLISLVISVSLAGILILNRRDDKQIQLVIAAMLSLAGLSFAAAMEWSAINRSTGEIWVSINYVLSILAVTTIYHSSYVSLFKKEPFKNKKELYLYLFPIFFSIFVIMGNLPSIKTNYNALGLFSRSYTAPHAYFYPLFYCTLALLLFLTAINFIRMYRQNEDRIMKLQALYFILAFLVIFIGIVITAVLLLYSIIIKWELTMIFLSIGLIIITVGILKHQLFDIEIIVKRTMVYSGLTLILVGIFRLVELGLSYFVSLAFFGGALFARLIAASIVAGSFFPLRKFGKKFADKLLPKIAETIALDKSRELDIYKKQLEYALEDGAISEKEERRLRVLRVDLGITDEEHERFVGEMADK